MSDSNVMPELKQILGSMIFAADRVLTLREMRKCLKDVAEKQGGEYAAFGDVTDKDLQEALAELQQGLDHAHAGNQIFEVAGGYRLQSDPHCGIWVKQLLAIDKPARLSKPALETLAIIAYRQPVTRADIESVRGVNVDHMVKLLLEMQLVRITGRSELPGRPFLYGTTQRFLEHFGLKSLKELSELDPMLAAGGPKKKAPPATPPVVDAEDARVDDDAEAFDDGDETEADGDDDVELEEDQE